MIVDEGPAGARATFSEDRTLRYTLERTVQGMTGGRVLAACGLNPSTADAFKMDPTCTRETGFARAWGCEIYFKVNAYSWKDTHPRGLWLATKRGDDIVGPHNDEMIEIALRLVKQRGGVALACWGVYARADRVKRLVEIASEVGIEWQCIGTNQDGSPKHPLYAKRGLTPVPWRAAS